MRGVLRPYNLVFVAALLIVFGLWNEARRTQEDLQHANVDAMHAMKVLSASNAVLAALTDIETGARGYALTGNAPFLEPYHNGIAQLPRRMSELRGFLDDTPANGAWLARLDMVSSARVAHARKVVESMQAGDTSAAAMLIRGGAGKQAMDEARGLIAQLDASEKRDLDAGGEKLAAELWRVDRNMTLGGVLALLLSSGMMISINARLAARRRLAQQAREGETRERDRRIFLRTIVDADDNLIFVRDAQGGFAFCNVSFAGLIDLHPARVVGRHPRDVDPQGLLDPLLAFGGVAVDAWDGTHSVQTLFLDGKGGERWFELIGRPFELTDGRRLFLTVGVDVTAHLRVERLKDEFVANVSHELRTPLTSIRGALEMVNSGISGEVPEGARQLLSIAHKNTERLVRLINDLLDIQKLESGQLLLHCVPGRIRPLLEQAVAQITPYAREYDVRLALAGGADGVASVDPDRFAQVMANLLSNAIKHSSAGGEVEIALDDSGPELVVTVADHGAGIPEHFRSQIFDRFAQAESTGARTRGGTGLGLAITHSLVRQMGGRIDFDSVEGQGTRFHVHLPKLESALEGEMPKPARASELALPGVRRILHVEDDIDMRQLIRRKFESDAIHVSGAGTLAGARALLVLDPFDLVILDLILPDGDGRELLQELEARVPPIPVIVFSGQDTWSGMDGVVEQLVKSRGHEDVLVKMVLDSLKNAHAPRDDING